MKAMWLFLCGLAVPGLFSEPAYSNDAITPQSKAPSDRTKASGDSLILDFFQVLRCEKEGEHCKKHAPNRTVAKDPEKTNTEPYFVFQIHYYSPTGNRMASKDSVRRFSLSSWNDSYEVLSPSELKTQLEAAKAYAESQLTRKKQNLAEMESDLKDLVDQREKLRMPLRGNLTPYDIELQTKKEIELSREIPKKRQAINIERENVTKFEKEVKKSPERFLEFSIAFFDDDLWFDDSDGYSEFTYGEVLDKRKEGKTKRKEKYLVAQSKLRDTKKHHNWWWRDMVPFDLTISSPEARLKKALDEFERANYELDRFNRGLANRNEDSSVDEQTAFRLLGNVDIARKELEVSKRTVHGSQAK